MAETASAEANGGRMKPDAPLYNVNIFPADTTGCDFYRNFVPRETAEHCIGDIMFNTCRKFTVDVGFFRDVNVNILQRQVSDPQCEYYLKFIIPMSRNCGSWIVYNIDDCIHKDDLPKYNSAWKVYQSDKYMDNIRRMVNASDFLLVTTEELGNYYTDRFGVNPTNIIVIPNYVPYWWMGHFFDLNKIVRSFDENVVKKHRPRIALIGAPSHYDMEKKGIPNDITPILDYVRKTLKDYMWVFMGSVPPELQDCADRGEIECHAGVDILHYPDYLNRLSVQYVVAPLADNVFNRCKSNIKLTESWALGMGCAAQNLPAYSKYTEDVFDDGDGLDAILKRDLKDTDTFVKKIVENRRKMDGWWLEGHMGEWLQLYRIRRKPLVFNYDQYRQMRDARKSGNGVVAPSIKAK